jgi:hypothetical protein
MAVTGSQVWKCAQLTICPHCYLAKPRNNSQTISCRRCCNCARWTMPKCGRKHGTCFIRWSTLSSPYIRLISILSSPHVHDDCICSGYTFTCSSNVCRSDWISHSLRRCLLLTHPCRHGVVTELYEAARDIHKPERKANDTFSECRIFLQGEAK